METEKRRTWAEVSLRQLEYNYKALRELLPQGCRFMGMVKSNAYGHGSVQISKQLEKLGADYLGVACVEEAVTLREGGVTLPILVLGGTEEEDVPNLLTYRLAQAVYDRKTAEYLSQAAQTHGKSITIHVKVDTGMSRLGFLCDETRLDRVSQEILDLCKLPGLYAEGIFTHFADSDSDEDFTVLQFTRFLNLLDKLEEHGRTFAIRHSANSGATLRYPFSYLDMVRPGIALYGYYPGEDMEELCPLAPVLELKSRVVSLSEFPAGTSVSYGRTATLDQPRTLAVVSIGYGDGFFRGFSNRFSVSICGRRAPIVGRVCMDMCMVDVTDIPGVSLWDEAVIYGKDSESGQSVEAGAKIMDTVSYEILCALSKRIPRLYIE